MKIKKVLLLIFTLVFAAMIGCENNSTVNNEKVNSIAKPKITLVFGTNKTDIANTTLLSLTEQYTRENPNITIEIQAYKDPDTEIKTKAVTGELPDVGLIPDDADSSSFSLYYTPLDDMGFNENNLYCYGYGLGDNKKLYGLNSGVNYSGIVYNKNSFRIAGIAKPPVTMKEFYEDCAKLKANDMIPLASNFKDKWPLSQYSNSCTLAISNTGNENYRNNLVNQDFFTNDNGLSTSFEILRNMNSMGFLEPDLMSTNWESMKQQQANGKIVMAYLGTWYPPQVIKLGTNDIGMFPFPGTKALPQSPDWLYGISKKSKHIKEAKAFLKWLWSDARYAKVCEMNSPLKAAVVDDPITKEILSYNLPIVNQSPNDAKFNSLFSNSQIDLQQALQEYITSSNPQAVMDKYNAKWAALRKQK